MISGDGLVIVIDVLLIGGVIAYVLLIGAVAAAYAVAHVLTRAGSRKRVERALKESNRVK